MTLQEILEYIRNSKIPSKEEGAKNKLVVRILSVLGWDTYGDEFEYEYAVGTKKYPDEVDIALKKGKHPVAFIEAKAPDKRLESHVDQVLGYAFHEGVDICALTTGLEWWLYLPREKGPPAERRFTVLNVKEDQIEQLVDDFERFLGRENLLSGEAEKRAKQVLEARREADHINTAAPHIWRSMLKGPDDELLDLLSKRIYDEVGLRPNLEIVRSVLQNSSFPNAPEASPKLPSGSQYKRKPGKSPTIKPESYWLWGRNYPVRYHVDILKGVIDALYERHKSVFEDMVQELIGKEILPSSKGIKTYRIGRGVSRYYIETNLSRSAIRDRIYFFLDFFGHPASDLEIVLKEE